MASKISRKEFAELWKGLSADRQAGFFVWPSLRGSGLTKREESLLRQYAPWGVSFFARSFPTLVQARQTVSAVRAAVQSGRPSVLPTGFMAIDEEGGRVSRLPRPFPKLPSMAQMATTSDEDLASQVILQAGVAKAVGVNMIYAPVCDLLVEPENRVIGDRSFGANVELVVEKARLVALTLQELGVCPVLKHFPGHGFTKEDTHLQLAHTDLREDVLVDREWKVFAELITSIYVPAVMTCHVVFESVDPGVPATFSKPLIEGTLRKRLRHEGLVISDDLRMNAIAQWLGEERGLQAAIDAEVGACADQPKTSNDAYLAEASLKALEAGCDVVLSCRSVEREVVCLQALSDRLQRDAGFRDACETKAFRVYLSALDFDR